MTLSVSYSILTIEQVERQSSYTKGPQPESKRTVAQPEVVQTFSEKLLVIGSWSKEMDTLSVYVRGIYFLEDRW